ncbi:site-specific DNA-methyltransferase [Helicobacter didelphidarum]|uniref:Methyltransferase n=1 Tax=Helicobacter didelphidarum TaxID=2040648 RepID=A0A3D8I8E4_9HELI|nr:site-specific DNA-methyltransferase [Helicobacter didelphidarum]RDU61285.1 site-specific DNA-methyltransferase [Helicobacter didelphidarum]
MFQIFSSLLNKQDILSQPYSYKLQGNYEKNNLLIFGENLNAMRYLLQEKDYKEKIDLVYIDPPFGTNNVFRLGGTMSVSKESAIAYRDNFRLESYLEFLYARLVLIYKMMSEKGSLYLHIDTKMGHYVKILLDEIFGREHYLNDITRIKCNPKNFKKRGYGNIKDMILFYAKSDKFIWNEVYEQDSNDEITKRFPKRDNKGAYTTIPLHAPGATQNGETGQEWRGLKPPEGRHWRCSLSELDRLENEGLIEWSKNSVPRKKIYAKDSKGKKIQDIWEFKDTQNPIYPTQKNHSMLRRIIQASSNKDSMVMDCFCGSGGFLYEAFLLGRRFVGIDESKEAIKINKKRLERYNQDSLYPCDYEYIESCKEEKDKMCKVV